MSRPVRTSWSVTRGVGVQMDVPKVIFECCLPWPEVFCGDDTVFSADAAQVAVRAGRREYPLTHMAYRTKSQRDRSDSSDGSRALGERGDPIFDLSLLSLV
jgi:hypothetical protein